MSRILAHATSESTAPASAFFDRWIDHATWTEWDPDTLSVTVDGPVQVGARGRLKPKGGPAVRFTVSVCERPREYTDVSALLGATLTFQHLATEKPGGTTVEAKAWLDGPLAPLWFAVMGKGFATSVPAALHRLVAVVEGRA